MTKAHCAKPELALFLWLLLLALALAFIPADARPTDFGGEGEPEEPADDPNQPPCNPEGDPSGEGDGDPVNAFTGKWYYRTVDMTVPGVFAIEIVRRYDSNTRYDSPLGYGWAFTHDMRLFEYPDGSVSVRTTCGIRHRYVPAGGAFDTPQIPGWRQALTLDGSGFLLTEPRGTKRYFDSQGRLTAIENPQGNRLEFSYDPAGKLPLTGTSPFAVDPTKPLIVARPYQLTRIEERTADGVLPGRHVDFNYDPGSGRLASIQSFDGRTVSYEHEIDPGTGQTTGNLERVIGLAGIEQTFGYTDSAHPHRVTSFQDGQATEPYINTYDSSGRVSTQTFGERVHTIVYEPTTAHVNHADDLLDCASLVCRVVRRRIVDDQGLNEEFAVAVRKYRTDGHPVQIIDPLGHLTVFSYETGRPFLVSTEVLLNPGLPNERPSRAQERLESFSFDPQGDAQTRAISVTTASGATETITRQWEYDQGWISAMQVSSDVNPNQVFRTEFGFERNPDGSPKRISEARVKISDSPDVFETTSFSYDVNGQLATTTLPDDPSAPGLRVARQYISDQSTKHGLLDELHLESEVAGVWSSVLERRKQYAYDSRGLLSKITDARGFEIDLVLDDAGRFTEITNALGETQRFGFSGPNASIPDPDLNPAPPGRLLSRVETGETSVDPDGYVRFFRWDDRGNLSAVDRRIVDGSTVTFELTETAVHDSDGRVLRSTDAIGRSTSFQYDLSGRMIARSDSATPSPNSTSFTYDAIGDQTGLLPAGTASSPILLDRDQLGRVIRRTVETATPLEVAEFEYDAAGNVVLVRDERGNETSYEFDRASRLTRVLRPLGQSVSFGYGPRGRLRQRTDARGHISRYSYSAWGGLESLDLFVDDQASTPDRSLSYAYDLEGNPTTIIDSQYSPTTPVLSYDYDELGRVEAATAHYLPHGDVVLRSEYDALGNRRELRLEEPAGSAQQLADGSPLTSTWVFDDRDRLKEFQYPGTALLQPTFYANDDLLTLPHGNGLETTLTYESNGPIDTVAVRNSGALVNQLDYGYDERLNVRTIEEDYPGAGPDIYGYNYDPRDRLIDANYPTGVSGLPAGEAFPYDVAGNRDDDPAVSTPWSYNENNEIESGPSHVYNFDLDGHLEIIDPGPDRRELTWNKRGRLVKYEVFGSGASVTEYSYGPFGRRIQKTEGAVTRSYLWDGDELVAEYDSTGLRTIRYSYSDEGSPLRVAYRNGSGGEDRFDIHTDHLSTPRVLTDASGTPRWRARQQAFGEAHIDVDPDGDGSQTNNVQDFNLRLPGQYFDSESGLHYNRFRYYDPGVGRYVANDPLGQIDQLNLYAYSFLSPLVFSDPLGLAALINCNRCKGKPQGQLNCRGTDDNGRNFKFSANDPDLISNYPNYDPANKDPYGENGPLPPGEYDVEPFGGGTVYPPGTPAITTPGSAPGVVQTPGGTTRTGVLFHSAVNRTDGCLACSGGADKTVKSMMDDNLASGGTKLKISEVDCDDPCNEDGKGGGDPKPPFPK